MQVSTNVIQNNIEQMLKNYEDQVKDDVDLEKLSPRNIAKAEELE